MPRSPALTIQTVVTPPTNSTARTSSTRGPRKALVPTIKTGDGCYLEDYDGKRAPSISAAN